MAAELDIGAHIAQFEIAEHEGIQAQELVGSDGTITPEGLQNGLAPIIGFGPGQEGSLIAESTRRQSLQLC